MAQSRKRYTGEEKTAILRAHLVDGVPVSDLCDRHGLYPTMCYRWQKTLFDAAPTTLDGRNRIDKPAKAQDRKIAALEAKLADKDSVIAEVMHDYVDLKKNLGRVETQVGAA